MAETDKPGHADAVVMVEVPAQLIAALYQAVEHAGGGKNLAAGLDAKTPAQAVAVLNQVAAQAVGVAVRNAVYNLQIWNQFSAAVVSKAIQMIMAMDSRATVMAAVPPDAAVVGEAPAMLMGTVYQTMAHSTGILFETAVAAQQQDTLEQAAANQGVMQIYSLDTAAGAAVEGATTEGIMTLLEIDTAADGAKGKPERLLDDTD